MKLYPWNDVIRDAEAKIALRPDTKVYQQFNCAGCGAKQTMEEPNKFYTQGRCEECDHITDIKKNGMNIMLTIGI